MVRTRKKVRFVLLIAFCLLLLTSCKSDETIRVHITEIVDNTTGELVEADVYVNSNLVSAGVTEATFDVPVPGEFEVRCEGYENWALVIKDKKTDRTFKGPVRLYPKMEGEVEG
jgi:hypothetical protein